MTLELKMLSVCSRPKMFAGAPEVCDNCGNLIDAHRMTASADNNKTLIAMWKILIQFGGTFGRWGGGADKYGGDMVREHMATCGIDFTRTELPRMDGLYTCTDSYAEPEAVSILNGALFCVCGKYRDEDICIDNMTLGQLIWHAAHLDDEPARDQEQS